MKEESNLIKIKFFAFAEEIIYLYIRFKNEKEFILSKQLVRSGTNTGANLEEALGAQSRKDFISKMSIANKESRETCFWLQLLQKTQVIKFDYKSHLTEITSIINILTAIVKSSQKLA